MMPVGILLKDLKFLPKIAYEYTNTIHIVGHLVSLKISWAKPVSKENIVGWSLEIYFSIQILSLPQGTELWMGTWVFKWMLFPSR